MDKNILMKNLGLSREQAEELIAADKEVDRMTKISDINSDLTPEQAKVAKKARAAERKRTAYKFDTKREKKINEPKKEIISSLIAALGEVDNLNVINDEREFTFTKDGKNYRITLACPRGGKT